MLAGGAASGFYAGISGLHNTVLITPGLPTLAAYLAGNNVGNFIHALVTAGIAFVVTFAATFILYRENPQTLTDGGNMALPQKPRDWLRE